MKTATGFEFELTADSLNNMELLDALGDMQGNPEDVTIMGKLVGLLLGKDGKKRLYDHCRTEDGRVPVDAVGAELVDIFNAGAEIKKSASSRE